MARSVLVVEDDALIRMLACEALESLDLDVRSCGCVDEAITVLETTARLDLVLTDIQMPGQLDGVDLAHLVIDRWPGTAVIVMSAGQRDAGSRLPGSATFLSKPWTVGQLLTAIEQTLSFKANDLMRGEYRVDKIAQLDVDMAILGQVADELERQISPSPVTRPLVIAWLTEWARQPGTVPDLGRNLPNLPQSLKAAYLSWTHQCEG